MTELPKRIKLEPKDIDDLKALDAKMQGLHEFVQLVSSQGEKRAAQLRRDTGEVWERLKEKYDLDLEHVNYTLDNDGEHIVPITMKLV